MVESGSESEKGKRSFLTTDYTNDTNGGGGEFCLRYIREICDIRG